MTQFIAKFAYSGESDGVLMAGLADDQYEAKQYILFQLASTPTREDVELGQDCVHVSLNGGLASAYGGIESVSLFADELEVIVDEKTASALGTACRFSVGFDSHLEGLDELSMMLKKMFQSFSDQRIKRGEGN